MKMLVSDYIVHFLKRKGIKDVFGYPGGMVTYLMDSIDRDPEVTQYLLYHEQACAFAACGYAQTSGIPGVVYATSGPGATNLITGICNAYYDSIPLICITGQVNTNEAKKNNAVRQHGFQETDIVKIVKPITKYCTHITNAKEIPLELEKIFNESISGRPGPALIDIPIDIQRAEIEIDINTEEEQRPDDVVDKTNYEEYYKILVDNIKLAKRPVIIAGNGINISYSKKYFLELLNRLRIPVVTSMISIDLLPSDHILNFGFIGTYGHRCANIITAKSDLIISIGSRMDIRQTGTDLSIFAPNAKIIRMDVDKSELQQDIKADEIKLNLELSSFMDYLKSKTINIQNKQKWVDECSNIKNKTSHLDASLPNNYLKSIGGLIPSKTTITTDVGQNQVWVAQSLGVKADQRILFSGGHGSMGYSLPAAIGAFVATKKPVFCFSGDGGMQMNIQELQTIKNYNMPIKIFVLNNKSLGMIRHFQEIYFDSNFTLTKKEGGYVAPNFMKIAEAYEIQGRTINSLEQISKLRMDIYDGPLLFEINLSDTTYLFPKSTFGRPANDQEPLIDRKLFKELMK